MLKPVLSEATIDSVSVTRNLIFIVGWRIYVRTYQQRRRGFQQAGAMLRLRKPVEEQEVN